jgi:hypothetical protein
MVPRPAWTLLYRVIVITTLGCVTSLSVPLLLIGKAEFFSSTGRRTEDLADGFNATFLLCAAIAALAFTMAQVVDPTKEEAVRKLVIEGGSFLFLGALWFLVAAVMRYYIRYDSPPAGPILSGGLLGRALVFLAKVFSLVLYVGALGASMTGLFCLFVGLFEKLLPIRKERE